MSFERRTYLRQSAVSVAAQVLSALCSLALIPLIARALGPQDYGSYSFLVRVSVAVAGILLFSLNDGVWYFTSKDPRRVGSLLGSGLVFLAGMSLALFLPYFLLSERFLSDLSSDLLIAIYLTAIATALLSLFQSVQRAVERFSSYASYNFLSVAGVGAAVFFSTFLVHDVAAVGLVRAGSLALLAIIGLVRLRAALSWDAAAFKDALHYAAPFGMVAIIGSLFTIGSRYILASNQPIEQVGFFELSSSISNAVLPLVSVFALVMGPKLVKDVSRIDAYYRKVGSGSMLLVTGFSLTMLLFNEFILRVLLGQGFVQQTSLPLIVMLLALPFIALFTLHAAIFSSLAKTKMLAFLLFLVGLTELILNWLLTPTYSAAGAAAAVFIGYALAYSFAVAYLWFTHRLDFAAPLRQVGLFLAALLAFYFGGFTAWPERLALLALFALLSYLLNARLVREMLSDGWHILRAFLRPGSREA
ncbi:oligosaccharide flippase family protein [Candidatus Micrarchaeota archaeon]|nr:oligosaccharide flippase family protein [Candidatus Micrarchaeota archaeon]